MAHDISWIIRNAHLWMDNEEPLYKRRVAFENNIERKILNGSYRRELMIGGVERSLLPEILKVMRAQGEFVDTPYENRPLSKEMKHAIATSLTRSIEAEARIHVRHGKKLDDPRRIKKHGFILAKHGYHGTVYGPTKFLVGEGGKPEHVDIFASRKTHHKKSSGMLDRIKMPRFI